MQATVPGVAKSWTRLSDFTSLRVNACLERIQEEMAEEKLEKPIIVMLFQEFVVKEGDK